MRKFLNDAQQAWRFNSGGGCECAHYAYTVRAAVLAKLPGYKFVVVSEVVAEITFADQATVLKKAIRAGILEVVKLIDIEDVANFAQLRQRLGVGESACIAIAQKHGWSIASDEKRRFITIARDRLGVKHILTIEDIRKIARMHNIVLT